MAPLTLETGRYVISFGIDEDGEAVTRYEKSEGVVDEHLLGALEVARERTRQRVLDEVTEHEPEEDEDAD